jgi:hypothetical protein
VNVESVMVRRVRREETAGWVMSLVTYAGRVLILDLILSEKP